MDPVDPDLQHCVPGVVGVPAVAFVPAGNVFLLFLSFLLLLAWPSRPGVPILDGVFTYCTI